MTVWRTWSGTCALACAGALLAVLVSLAAPSPAAAQPNAAPMGPRGDRRRDDRDHRRDDLRLRALKGGTQRVAVPSLELDPETVADSASSPAVEEARWRARILSLPGVLIEPPADIETHALPTTVARVPD